MVINIHINMDIRTAPLLLPVLSMLLLAGCGFQLRGAQLPPEFSRVAVVGDDRDLVVGLEKALARYALVEAAHGQHDAQIDISQSEFSRKVLTTDANGRANSYALHYQIAFSITVGGELGINDSFALQRVYRYEPLRQLQAEREIAFLQTDMRDDAVARILNRLQH